MTMGRNESVAHIVMLLCFGTAILSLAVHRSMIAGERQFEESASTRLRRDATMASSAASASTLSSMPAAKSAKVEKNVTREAQLAKNNRLVVDQAKKPKFFLAQIAQPKSVNSVAGKSQVVVDLSDRRTYVYAKDEVIASYPIAVGKKGWETPTGSFQVMHMQHYPAWRHPITGKVFAAGTDSPLGDRWIGFWSDGRNQIGFHGTPDVEVIGTAISHGCLRMRNPDVRMLYKQVGLGTTVIVRE
ncbi:L,D-transpeptidase [Hassallia byssoidea VB512170]|uniref:L,D-transpeptidase n=1 Tax=Hassallia byssoidea VB512170 TaxID=1304833 RepID=A0A846H393_9CYAN|nr:L,D-transpeptidase [Hassalia byssoidea]NEU71685.1 L,D-transpeptidase [Hassalia byssoidea VB512170]